jgi:DNA-binding NtrC family response regulator
MTIAKEAFRLLTFLVLLYTFFVRREIIMSLMTGKELDFARTATDLFYSNPFLAEWTENERRILGPDYIDEGEIWNARPTMTSNLRVNLTRIEQLLEINIKALRTKLLQGQRPNVREKQLYEEIVLFFLYQTFNIRLQEHALVERQDTLNCPRCSFFGEFQKKLVFFLSPLKSSPALEESGHIFACFYQIKRAFHFTFDNILGSSMPAARLRAAVWQSVFTHDMRRYRRHFYLKMTQFATLITGPSGSGKELVAQAIGLSRYVPFDSRRGQFCENYARSLHSINLSALSPSLIESELFGYRKGSFTGATSDRVGWLELCSDRGSIFLDEIGDLNMDIQVKLLRVIETRSFHRIGDPATRRFNGKIIAATNRDLPEEISKGTFRHDLFYRLCADTVRTPALAEQITGNPEELDRLISYLCWQTIGEEYAEAIATEVRESIQRDLPSDYSWPGNIRELTQCIRNVMIRGEYRPPSFPANSDDPIQILTASLLQGGLSADELLSGYVTHIYAATGSYEEASRRLKLDRRTVKARIDQQLLASIRTQKLQRV